MRLFLLLICLLSLNSCLNAQDSLRWKHRFPIWFTPAKNTQIHGAGLGVVNFWDNKTRGKTNGISVEIGLGLLLPIAAGSPVSDYTPKQAAERDGRTPAFAVNGLSLSATGSINCDAINGLSLNGVGTATGRMRGIQLAPVMCVNWELQGICASIFANDAYRVHGVQLGLVANKSADHRGVQIGFWNAAKKMRGLQIGLVNKSKDFRGLQIGLWNIHKKRSFPLLNWR